MAPHPNGQNSLTGSPRSVADSGVALSSASSVADLASLAAMPLLERTGPVLRVPSSGSSSSSPPPSPVDSPTQNGKAYFGGAGSGMLSRLIPRPVKRMCRRFPVRTFLKLAVGFLVFLIILSWYVSLPPSDEVNKPPDKVITDFVCPVNTEGTSTKRTKLSLSTGLKSKSADSEDSTIETILSLSSVPKMPSNASPAKYLVLLSEHNERLDFINAFHGSLLTSGAGRDSIVIVYSLEPSAEFLALLNHYREALGQRIEIRKPTLGGRKIELERFVWYRTAMEEFTSVSMVMLTDYDVVFQRHPFLDYPVPVNGIALASEWADFAIGDCSHHREWLLCGEPYWGKGTMQRLKPYPRICAGMIVGYRPAAHELLSVLSNEIERTGCNDQGILNYLYYSCLISHLNVTVHSNEHGLGGTVGSNPHYWSNTFGDLVNQDGEIQAWIHQYKWHPAAISSFMSKWPLPSGFGKFRVMCRTRVWLWCWDEAIKAWPWKDGRGWIALYRWENWMLRNLVRRFSGYRF